MYPEATGSYISAYFYGGMILVAILFFLLLGKYRNWKRQKRLLKNFGSLGWSRFKIDELRANYAFSQEKRKGESQVDVITWNDLEMDEFLLKHQCFYSSLGAQYLYESLHYFEGEEVLQRRRQLIDMNSQDMDRSILFLFQLGSQPGANLPYLIEHAHRSVFPYWFLLSMTLLTLSSLVMIPFHKTLGFVSLGLFSLLNSFIYSRGSKKIRDRLHSADYFLMLLKVGRKLENKLSDEQLKYKAELKKTLEPFRLVRTSNFNAGLTSSPEITALKDLVDAFLLDSLRKYARIAGVLKQNKEAAHELLRLVGEVELALFMKAMMKNKQLCKANFTQEKTLNFQGLYHPMVEKAIPYTREKNAKLLVTGSNASGKSTFMKAMGLSILFSQVSGYAFAEKFSLSPGELLSSMALRDSIEKGESYFVTEIKSLRRILEKTKNHYCYCFIDEILRGTNTIERIASSTSVLEALGKRESCVFVATHDIELTELLKDYENVHFREVYEGNDILFDYELLEGPSDTRNAILLLKIMGFGEEIIEEAQSRAEKFVETRRWS